MISSRVAGRGVIGVILAGSLLARTPSAFGAPGVGGTPQSAVPGSISDATVYAAIAALGALVLASLWIGDVIRPGSFARSVLRDVAAMPWWGWLMGAVALFVAQVIGAQLAFGVMRATGTDPDAMAGTALLHLFGTGVPIATGVFLIYALRPGVRSGLTARAGDLPIGLGCFLLAVPLLVAASVVATVAAALVEGAPPPPIAHETLQQIVEHRGDPWAWAVAFAAIVGAPIAEELLYRVFLQSAVLRATGSAWTAIVATSVIFAAAHLGVAPWHTLLPLALLGVAMGLAYEHTRRLGVPIVMHVLFNAANVAMAVSMV